MSKQQESENLEIKEFDPKSIEIGSVCMLIGKRHTGKSFLLKNLLYHFKDKIPIVYVCSGTEHVEPFYEKFIPKIFIKVKHDHNYLAKLYDRQIKAKQEEWCNKNISIVYDDQLHDKNWFKDELIAETFYNGRHYSITSFFASQTPLGLPSNYRSNIDYIFLMKCPQQESREKLWKYYGGIFPSKRLFLATLDACTEDYGCLVLNNRTNSSKLTDQVFFYTANNCDFRMCPESFWKISKEEELKQKRNKDYMWDNNSKGKIEKKEFHSKKGDITITKRSKHNNKKN
jgi:hypothetical protein